MKIIYNYIKTKIKIKTTHIRQVNKKSCLLKINLLNVILALTKG